VEEDEKLASTDPSDTQPKSTEDSPDGSQAMVEAYEATQVDPEAANSELFEGRYETIIDGTAKDHGTWSLEVHTNNGSPRAIVLGDYSTAPDYQSIWGYVMDSVMGSETSEEGWNPYSRID
jgi:hypothetical protein